MLPSSSSSSSSLSCVGASSSGLSSSSSSTSAGASTSTISPEELAEIQSYLDRRSRHVVKTIVSPGGVVFDCVPYDKQPAFDNTPPIMDYKIPDISKFGIRSASDTTTYTPRVCLQCPEGTVPIPRLTLEDMLRIRSLPNGGRKTWCPAMIVRNPPDSK
ncbi:hypothetical protein ACMD2_15037 [Ananas comosus]|uniref:Neprosin activation peptide domain-containing protein n=1 Tax=Ananas comosus TaxID=4615 RepID=A0A199W375_ANACO|nr:hypothetical protein ACMD2_15037 [Ananas comosus]